MEAVNHLTGFRLKRTVTLLYSWSILKLFTQILYQPLGTTNPEAMIISFCCPPISKFSAFLHITPSLFSLANTKKKKERKFSFPKFYYGKVLLALIQQDTCPRTWSFSDLAIIYISSVYPGISKILQSQKFWFTLFLDRKSYDLFI